MPGRLLSQPNQSAALRARIAVLDLTAAFEVAGVRGSRGTVADHSPGVFDNSQICAPLPAPVKLWMRDRWGNGAQPRDLRRTWTD